MLLTRDKSKGEYEIKSYTPGKIVVNDQTYTKSIVINADTLISDWRPLMFADLKVSDFDIVLQLKPEIIVLGTGETMLFPDQQIMQKITGENVGLETMNNSAACRTFNVLMSEGRNAVIALLMNG